LFLFIDVKEDYMCVFLRHNCS